MSPDAVTTSQIVGAFTAKHWIAVITTTFAGFSAIASGAYWVGQRVAESQALAQQADLKAINSEVQAKLEVSESHAKSLITVNTQLREVIEKSRHLIERKNQDITRISSDLGRSNNCEFIQKQILATKDEIDGFRQFTLAAANFGEGNESFEKQKSKKPDLEQRLAGYQQQLGFCNK